MPRGVYTTRKPIKPRKTYDGKIPKHRINIWICDQCQHKITTINRDKGIVPLGITCQKCGSKDSMGHVFYKCNQNLIPLFEWYLPTDEELINQSEANKKLVAQGYMLLRPLSFNQRKEYYKR